MSSLRSLVIANCNLSGGLPEALGQLSNITYLVLRCNQLANLPPLACMRGELLVSEFGDMPAPTNCVISSN